MKNIFAIVIFTVLIFTIWASNAYPSVFAVINQDGSIHTVESTPNEVLQNGQKRFEIPAFPDKHPNNYKWSFSKKELIEKTSQEIKEMDDAIEAENEKFVRTEKIEAQKSLDAIAVLTTKDPNEDYSKDKQKFDKIINDRKK